MQLILFGVFSFGKMWENMEKLLFLREAMALIGEIQHGWIRPDWGLWGQKSHQNNPGPPVNKETHINISAETDINTFISIYRNEETDINIHKILN